MQDMMPLFKKALYRWAGYVRMQTGSTTYLIENNSSGEFTLVVGGGWGTHRKFFSRKMVWGTTTKLLPPGKKMTKRTCDFVQDIIDEVNGAKKNAVHDKK